jgi:hypothetical protein
MSESNNDTAWMSLMAAINLLGIYAPIHALIGSSGGRYSRATGVFAWICIGWAIETCLGTYWEYFNDPSWFGFDVIILVPWSILIFLAGIVSLQRLRRNKRERISPERVLEP